MARRNSQESIAETEADAKESLLRSSMAPLNKDDSFREDEDMKVMEEFKEEVKKEEEGPHALQMVKLDMKQDLDRMMKDALQRKAT